MIMRFAGYWFSTGDRAVAGVTSWLTFLKACERFIWREEKVNTYIRSTQGLHGLLVC